MSGGGTQTLDAFVSSIQTNAAAGKLEVLSQDVRKAASPNGLLSKNRQHLDTILETLHVQQHSLGYLAILLQKMPPTCEEQMQTTLALISNFFDCCNGEQIRYAIDLYSELCHRLTKLLLSKNRPQVGVSILCQAITRLVASPSQLTAIHADLCCLCLKAKIMKPALQFLDCDITDIAKYGNAPFDSKYFLSYYYYGGMIYTALKMYPRALFFFQTAVCTPSTAVSQIMVESYKKLQLISLIEKGKVDALPRYVSSVVNRFIKPSCQAYQELVTSYASTNPHSLIENVSKHMNVFQSDSNWGLVQQCLTSYYKRNILRLTKTFITLSLADVANRCHLAGGAHEAERYIIKMVDSGEILARIDGRLGMVRFEDSTHNGAASNHFMNKLEEQLNDSLKTDALVQKLDTDTFLSPNFAMRVSKQSVLSQGVLPDDEGVSVGGMQSDWGVPALP